MPLLVPCLVSIKSDPLPDRTAITALPSTNCIFKFFCALFYFRHFMLRDFIKRAMKASIAKQLHYFRLLILTHPLCCRSFENYKKKNHYLVLASPMTAEPSSQVSDLVNPYGLSDSPCYLSFLPFSPLLLRESLFSHENVILFKKICYFDSIIDGVLCFSSDISLWKAFMVKDLKSVTLLVILSKV